MTYRLVNDAGIAALKALAQREPRIFIEPDTDWLETRMVNILADEDIWGSPLKLQADLSSLERIDGSGPETDAMFAPIVRDALPNLKPADGLDEYTWATMNCFVVPRYAHIRWKDTSNMWKDPKRLPSYVESHWLKGNVGEARRANAVARLWWLGELSSRAAKASPVLENDEVLHAMADNVNLYHQLLSRRYILARPRLVAAIYEMFLEGDNDHLNVTAYASQFLSALNIRAADVSLDLMDRNELRDAVEEAKPPKGR